MGIYILDKVFVLKSTGVFWCELDACCYFFLVICIIVMRCVDSNFGVCVHTVGNIVYVGSDHGYVGEFRSGVRCHGRLGF